MRVFITGVTGQDGSILAEQLASAGHEVYGLLRGQWNPKRLWIKQLVPSITLLEGDLLDHTSLHKALVQSEPEVVYNLGALTYVGMSWDQPTLMTEVTGLGCLRMLQAIRAVNPGIRFVQASSSEQFGSSSPPQDEATVFRPRSPYGVAKTFAHYTTVNYRESYGLHASTAIMFNHTSTRRGEEFVERKISKGVANIFRGSQAHLTLGNLHSSRDVGWAPEYMRALPLIAAQPDPGDYCLATGVEYTVESMAKMAFKAAGIPWNDALIRVDKSLYRPADVERLRGSAVKAERILGWEATVELQEIMKRLVTFDLGHWS